MQHDINRFCAPQNITKDALLVISALYSLVTDTRIELSCRVIFQREKQAHFATVARHYFFYKNTK